MCQIDDFILTRRDYSSLDPQQIFQHLINRDILEILEIRERDYVYELYAKFDLADDSPNGMSYKDNLCWQYTAVITETKRFNSLRKRVKIQSKGKIDRLPSSPPFHCDGGFIIEEEYSPFFFNGK